MAGLPSGLGAPSAPQYGTGDASPSVNPALGGADPDQGEDNTLQQLVADAHKLAAELTRFAIQDEQEDQGPPPGAPPAPTQGP